MALVHRLELMFDINVTRIEHKENDLFKGIYGRYNEHGNIIFKEHSAFLDADNSEYESNIETLLVLEVARHAFDSSEFLNNIKLSFRYYFTDDDLTLDFDIDEYYVNEYTIKKGSIVYVMKDQYLYCYDDAVLSNSMTLIDYGKELF